jgi:zinc protease
MALVQKYFGDIGRSKVPPFGPPALEPPSQERTETLTDALAELPAFHIAYHIPPSRTPDHYPLEMLAVVLGDGKSSRLYQKLVKDQEILQDIFVGTDDRRGPDLFSFWAVVSGGGNAERARQKIYEELADVARKGVSARELEKARNRVRASFVFGLQSNLSRAMQLAEFELYWGDAKLLRDELERYLAVSREDIQRVAQQYFAPKNRTVLDVVPAEQGGQDR